MTIVLEACVDSVATAVAAQNAGADRVELCGPGDGGTTPSAGLIAECRAAMRIPMHVMIRCRPGEFVCSASDIAVMQRDIVYARSAGADGVVFGVLQADHTVHRAQTAALVNAADGLATVFHRAFDRTPHADEALETLQALGVNGVLTSGHSPTALAGAATLRRLLERASAPRTGASAHPFTVMAGGHVRADTVRALLDAAPLRALHARATDPAVFAALVAAVRAHEGSDKGPSVPARQQRSSRGGERTGDHSNDRTDPRAKHRTDDHTNEHPPLAPEAQT